MHIIFPQPSAKMVRRFHHHLNKVLSQIREAPLLDQSTPPEPNQVLPRPLLHSRSLSVRTPPDVSGGSSESSDGSSSDNSSGDNDSSSDSKGSGSGGHGGTNISVPVALGVIIPILLAVVIFVYLHRRHVKKLRQEDANDPHKSLDFGWDPSANVRNKKRVKRKEEKLDVAVSEIGLEKGSRRDRGLSMDIDVGSPYLLPPGLQGSQESLHSMSRSIRSQDDRYRPATSHNLGDGSSIYSHRTGPGLDDSSSHAGSSSLRRGGRDDMKQDLLGNAQRMSRSMPPTDHSPVPQIQIPEPAQEVPRKPLPSNPTGPSTRGLEPGPSPYDSRDSYQPIEHLRKSNNYLGAFIHSREPSADVLSPETGRSDYLTLKESPATPSSTLPETESRKSPPPAINVSADPSSLPRQQPLHSSQHASIEQNAYDDGSEYGDAVKVTPASPRSSQLEYQSTNRGSSQEYMPSIDEYSLGVDESEFGYDVRRLSIGLRPLPPEDPNDNPEQRANRIRSFYKEYFDSSRPPPSGAEYYEGSDENYLGDGAIFDPTTGDFMTGQPGPYAEPEGRRAMSPPVRVGRRHAATMSASSRLVPPGPRAYSSVSNRYGPGPRRPPPKRKLPPPKELRVLPTPHMLKEDAFALPIDFAPPTGAKEQRAGVPQSPLGGSRPYSPTVRVHTPLAKSYDDLAVMPSPHLLRKSGTFTALDFAPPPRFKNSDTASDAGSIRSNRSGVSARTQHAVRTGAYRVSRIPKEIVGTKGDLMASLKPQWDLHNNTGTIGMSISR